MEINKKSFVEYIVRNSEQEGHFKYFEDRARVWTALKEDNDTLQSLVCILLTEFENCQTKWASDKCSGEIRLYMEWTSMLNTLPSKLGFAKEPDMYAILQALGKHAFDYMTKEMMTIRNTMKEAIAAKPFLPQPEGGLHVVAGGCWAACSSCIKNDVLNTGKTSRLFAE